MPTRSRRRRDLLVGGQRQDAGSQPVGPDGVLVLTYNRTLSSVTKSLIEELVGPLPENLEVMTLHQFMTRVLLNGSPTAEHYEKLGRRVPETLHEQLAELEKRLG